MEIEFKEIPVSEVFDGYVDSAENGVKGYHEKLDIRPPFQREFVYGEKERDAVIRMVMDGFPLNVMYWCDDGKGNYQLLDGQQRTLSICQYLNNDFTFEHNQFHSLPNDIQENILNYKLMIYICRGKESEKLKWFETINIAGVELTPQELRNAVYTGSWLTDAKKYFSKNGCPAYKIASKLVSGVPIRQEYLQTAIEWIICGDENCKKIEDYMSVHQHDSHANELWLYFQQVISWVNAVFPKNRKEMKGIKWGILYHLFKEVGKELDPKETEEKIKTLMMDDDVTNKKGIYTYILSGEEKHLNIRAFTESMKRKAYEEQGGICKICGQHFEFEQMEGDHITPWHDGGKTEQSNLQMLCKKCNREKSGK